jgi:hypothetical protein
MTLRDLADFERTDLNHRFVRGGLPPFFLDPDLREDDFREWMEAYWARDIQELFRLERRQSFIRFAELVMSRSGGIFEATSYAGPCAVSRGTIMNYLSVLEATFIAHVIRPFASYRTMEIVSAPKLYAFDTGFVCYHRGVTDLRREDLGLLWEHFVLNELHAGLQTRDIRYWRDKRGHEVDFVLASRNLPPTVIECKWRGADFDPANLMSFRRRYPDGANYVAASDVDRPFTREYDELKVRFVDAMSLTEALTRTLSN